MDYAHIAAGVSLLVVICYYYLTKNYGYWKRKGVPCLKGALPGLGNVYPIIFLRKNLFQLSQEFYSKMPGCSMVGFYYGREPALLVRDPELVKSVFQTNFSSFRANSSGINGKQDRILMRNPLFLQGEEWKAARQDLSSAFTSGKLKNMYESTVVVCAKFVNYLDNKIQKGNGEIEVEFKELFSRFTAEVVSSAAFGIEGNSFKDDKDGIIIEIGKSIFEPSFVKGVNQHAVRFAPLLANIFNASLIPPKIDKVFGNLIKDMIKYRADHKVQRSDFLQLMINLKKSGASDHTIGRDFADEIIASYSASFFIEIYETSSITLSFVFHQLASCPDIQQRVRDEVLTVFEKYNGITYEALREMTYMDQVIYESMRLHSAVGVLLKTCTDKIELKGSDGITCEVTPGTLVMTSVCGLQRDPEYWPDPERFDPERFTEENKQKIHKFTYLVFGEGPRACVGTRVAMLQIKAAIATTIKNYAVEPSPKTQLPLKMNPHYFMASPIGGLWAKLKPL